MGKGAKQIEIKEIFENFKKLEKKYEHFEILKELNLIKEPYTGDFMLKEPSNPFDFEPINENEIFLLW